MAARPAFSIGADIVDPGARRTVQLPISVLSNHTPVALSVHVIHAKREGPAVFVSAAVHGDEIIGVEIVRRLMRAPALNRLRGTLILAPIVNTFGFLNHSRYLPDRRDLNRCFPGQPRGSLADRIAHLFVHEVVARCDVGVDLHSAAIHRSNYPQIRISPDREEALALAQAFGAPVVLVAPERSGSLREAAREHGVEMLLFEGGEGLRFDEFAVRVGVSGVLRVLRKLDMIPSAGAPKKTPALLARSSYWSRAGAGGLLRAYKTIGDGVEAEDLLGVISDPFGETEVEVRASKPGLLIGRTNLPVVNEGDALFHIAVVPPNHDLEAHVETVTAQLASDKLFDEDEII
ncbi:MAG: succinylglutamate desuccinylase/aspartoacylase family protein [Maricaulaceae bacterium]